MKKLIAAAGLAALTATLPTLSVAQDKKEASPHTFTGNVGFASEYRYRGIAQTNGKPALQGGFDYSHASGFYLGTWGSNVSWLSDQATTAAPVSNSLELDLYGGYKGAVGDLGYDIGFLQYLYPGSYPKGFTKPDTLEAYVGATWKMLTLKYSHSLTDTFGNASSKGSSYLDLTGNFELPAGFTLVAHVGSQTIAAGAGRAKSACSYTDWKLGVTKEVAGLTWGVSYIDTNAKGGMGQCYRNAYSRDMGKGVAVLSVTKTF
ncbi:MAG: TorF family putative porin [Betaproteobacteria bacterium]|nr:TorF family putative porin [Betaproteobacteria bacterium]